MNKLFIFRLIVNIFLFISVINGWWFFAIPLIIIGFWFQYFYLEGLLAGVFFDCLFGMMPVLYIWSYVGIITSVLVWLLVKVLKKITRR